MSHKLDRNRHRSWEDVTRIYNAANSTDLSVHKVRDIGLRAAKKLIREFRKPENYQLRQALEAEGLKV